MPQVLAIVIGLASMAFGAIEVWLSLKPDHPVTVLLRQGPVARSLATLRWTGLVLFAIGVFIIVEWVVIR